MPLTKIKSLVIGAAALIAVLGFSLRGACSANADAVDNLWQNIKSIQTDMNQKVNDKELVNELVYELATEMCYLYKFRSTHGLSLDSNNIIKSTYLEITQAHSDLRLQNAIAAWNLISIMGMISMVNPQGFDAKIVHYFTYTQGYTKAVSECSEDLQFNIKSSFERDLQRNLYISAGGSLLLSVVGGYALIKRIITAPWVLQFAQKFPNLSKNTVLALGVSFTGLTALTIYTLKEEADTQKLLAKELTERPEELMPSADMLWTVRKSRYYTFIKEYKKTLDSIDLQRIGDSSVEELLGADIVSEINYFKLNLYSLLQQKRKLAEELEAVKDLRYKINSYLKRKKNNLTLNDKEKALLEKARFYGALSYIISTVNTYSNLQASGD